MGRGDRLRFGQVEFIVVDKIGPEPKRVGIVLEPDPEDLGWRRRLASRTRSRLQGLRQRLPTIGSGAGSG